MGRRLEAALKIGVTTGVILLILFVTRSPV